MLRSARLTAGAITLAVLSLTGCAQNNEMAEAACIARGDAWNRSTQACEKFGGTGASAGGYDFLPEPREISAAEIQMRETHQALVSRVEATLSAYFEDVELYAESIVLGSSLASRSTYYDRWYAVAQSLGAAIDEYDEFRTVALNLQTSSLSSKVAAVFTADMAHIRAVELQFLKNSVDGPAAVSAAFLDQERAFKAWQTEWSSRRLEARSVLCPEVLSSDTVC